MDLRFSYGYPRDGFTVHRDCWHKYDRLSGSFTGPIDEPKLNQALCDYQRILLWGK